MSEERKPLHQRRNFTLKFDLPEGSSEYVPFSCPTSDEGTPPPSPPCAKRQRVDLDEEEEEFEASGEDEASGEEASGDEASGEEEGGASAPWSGVREKYLQYDVAYVQALGAEDLPHLHQLGRWYFPNSCPRTEEEWDYIAAVRNAVQKRLLQLHCTCNDCTFLWETLPFEELLEYI